MDYHRRSRIDYSESRRPVKISRFLQYGRGVCETFLFKRGSYNYGRRCKQSGFNFALHHQNHSDTPLKSGNIRSRGFRNKDRIVDTFCFHLGGRDPGPRI